MARILLVDDEPTNQELLGEYLRAAGFAMAFASDGEQALAALEKERFDLVLLDVQMPVRDGFSTLEAIRAKPELAGLQVLLLTCLDQSWHKVRGLELGADDYLVKTCSSAELLARVKVALRRAASSRDASAMMEGALGAVRLVDLLQTLEAGNQAVRVALPDIDGELVMRGGALLSARQERFEGPQALLRILLLERGRFSVHAAVPPDEKGPALKLAHLLLSALAEVDELRRDLTWVPDRTRLQLDELRPTFEALAPLMGRGPMTATQAVAGVEGDLRQAVQLLKGAAQAGVVRLVRGEE